MSVEAMSAVWKMDLPPSEKLVLEAYADHADRHGGSIFPAVASIAKKTGLSKRSVQLHTRNLESAGVLVPDGRGPRGTRRWRIRLDWGPPGEAPQASAGDSDSHEVDPGGANSAPPQRGERSAAVKHEGHRNADPAPLPRGEHSAGVKNEMRGGANTAPNHGGEIAAGVKNETQGGETHRTQGMKPDSPESSLIINEPSTRIGLSRSDIEKANAQVTAMIALSAQATYQNRDKIPEPYLTHADTYNAVTGQVPTPRVLADWLSTFGIWKSEGIQATHVRQAFEASRGRFTVVRPGSLTDTAAALRAKAAVSKAGGKPRDWTAASIAEFQFRLDRSRRIQAEWYMSRGMAFEDPEEMRPRISDIPRLLSADLDEPRAKHATREVHAKIGELVNRLGSRTG